MYNATMMAYGPVENPEIAVAIVAEKAGNGYYLAETVRGIFEEYYRLKELRQNPDWREMLELDDTVLQSENTEGQTDINTGDLSEQHYNQQGINQQYETEVQTDITQ